MSTQGPCCCERGRICSGAMYAGVPTTSPVAVKPWLASSRFAKPKSVIFGSQSANENAAASTASLGSAGPCDAVAEAVGATSRILLGFKSRWRMPLRCAASMAKANFRTNWADSRAEHGRPRNQAARFGPATNSKAK